MKLFALLLSALLLAACGGGGGSTSPSIATTPTSFTTSEQLAFMVDSLGRVVPEADFGGGDIRLLQSRTYKSDSWDQPVMSS